MLAKKRTTVLGTGAWIKSYVSYGFIRPVKIYTAYKDGMKRGEPVEINGYLHLRYKDASSWVVLLTKEEYQKIWNSGAEIHGFHRRQTAITINNIIPKMNGSSVAEYLSYLDPCEGCLRDAIGNGVSVELVPTGPEVSIMKQNIFATIYDKAKNSKNEVGIELELEALQDGIRYWSNKPDVARLVKRIETSNSLIHDIGIDGSVSGGGPEIRFNHPSLSKWTKPAITKVLKDMSDMGFTAGASAGQHVHISHPKIWIAIEKCEKDIKGMNTFLMPVSCRHATHYGTGSNIIRNQMMQFGTLEIRVWESTLNPELFRMRAKFCNDLVKMLVKNGINYQNIWRKMPKSMLKAYVDMLFIENDHKIGLSVRSCLFKLPKEARAYARVKWGYDFKKQPKGE